MGRSTFLWLHEKWKSVAGFVFVTLGLLVCVAILALYTAPLLLLTPDEWPLSARIVMAAGYLPPTGLLLFLVYLGGNSLGAEHPWTPRRYLANAAMIFGILPWLVAVAIPIGCGALLGRGRSNEEDSDAGSSAIDAPEDGIG